MKIALVSPYDFPYPGGVTEHTAALASGLRRRGYETQVLAACSGFQGLTFPNTRVITDTVTAVPIAGAVARVGLSPFSYVRLRRILQEERFDVIHLQEPLTPSITWWTLLLAHALPHTITVGTFHAHHERPNWLYKRGRPIFGKFFAKLDALIAVSEPARQFAMQMFPGSYRIIPNGIDLARFGNQARIEPRGGPDLTILFVGRLDWRKGFQKLFESFIRLKPDYPHLRLRVVGPFDAGAGAAHQRVAQDRGITGIEFMGYVPPEQLPGIYHQADIFCAPSVGFESFGIILLEAMAAGLPMVASDIAGYRSVVTHTREGLLVSPDHALGFDNALRQLLDNPQLRYTMGQNGRRKARCYSWDRIVDQVLALYQQTLAGKMSAAQQDLGLSQGSGRKAYPPAIPRSLPHPVKKF